MRSIVLLCIVVFVVSVVDAKKRLDHKQHGHTNKKNGRKSSNISNKSSKNGSRKAQVAIAKAPKAQASPDTTPKAVAAAKKPQAAVAKPDPTTSDPPAPSPSAPAPTAGLSDLAAQLVAGHNSYRAAHGAGPLEWDDTLAAYGQTVSDKCVFEHSGGPYGENLASNSGGDWDIPNLLGMWEQESSSYDPANPVYSHFTQVGLCFARAAQLQADKERKMVWQGSTKLGCGTTLCAPGTIFPAEYGQAQMLACEYSPVGNVDGEFAANVQ